MSVINWVKSLNEVERPKLFLQKLSDEKEGRKKLLSLANFYAKLLEREKFSEVARKEELIESIIQMLDEIELKKPAVQTAKVNEIAGDVDSDKGADFAGSVKSVATDWRLDAAPEPKKAMVIESGSSLIAPKDQCRRIKISDSAENIAAVVSALSKLLGAALLNPKLEIESGEKSLLIVDVIKYGRKSGKRTFFSHPDLDKYLLNEVEKLEFKPKDSKLVPFTEFVEKHIRIERNKETYEKIEKLLLRLLETPEKKIKLEDGSQKRVSELINLYRSNKKPVTIYWASELAHYVMKELGIPPVVPKKTDNITAVHEKIKAMGSIGTKQVRERGEELEEFLSREIIANPDQVINEKTGRKLKNSIFTYRTRSSAGVVTYLHNDIDDFLKFNWVSPLPGEGHWYSAKSDVLAAALGVTLPQGKRFLENPHLYGAIKQAMAEILEDLYKNHRHNKIKLSNDQICKVGDIVKRIARPKEKIKYCVESEGLNLEGIITKEMVEARAKEIADDKKGEKFTDTIKRNDKNDGRAG